LRIKQDTQRDGLPTDHKIFLGYPPFQITSHNSQFNSFEYSSSYVDGLPTEHQFFLEVSALSFNFAQLPFWLLSILLLILYELPTEHQIFLGCPPFQTTLNNSHFNPWVFFFLYLTDFRQNTKFSWSIRPFG
jgi:hypothetical protein